MKTVYIKDYDFKNMEYKLYIDYFNLTRKLKMQLN